MDAARWMNSEGVPESISKSILASRLLKPGTGVKGVLADYQAACEMEAAVQEAERLKRNAIIKRMVEGSKRADEILEELVEVCNNVESAV